MDLFCSADIRCKNCILDVHNLLEIQFSAKIKKLNTDNGGEYLKKVMTAILKTKGIIHDLSLPYTHKSNSKPEGITQTIVTMVRSMMLDCANMISQALWAEAYSTPIFIKNCLLHSAFKPKKSTEEIMFSDKPSIKYLYPFGAK
jgi:hypothetical protein